EMTPAEAAQYDRSLDVDDRARMTAEIEMERRLGELLAQPMPDAQEAWRAALALVKEEKHARRPRARWLRRAAWLAVPIAAMVLVTVYMGHAKPASTPWFLSVSERDHSALASTARIPDVLLAVRNLLHDRSVNVSFDPSNSLEAENAPYRLLDAREGEYAGGPVMELLFACSGQLAKVVIANEKGGAAREIDKAVARGAIRASRAVGDWLIAVVGAKEPDGLLRLIGDPDATPPTPAAPATETPESAPAAPPPADAVQTPAPQESPTEPVPPEPPASPSDNNPVSVKTVA
ncbi:MAG: hypothetical protein NTU83_11115, partial [Candidatus Hydrogenedentes bacterium]|nr:hypothetical protein [Candidatus Hydrogenedentota bacterium]